MSNAQDFNETKYQIIEGNFCCARCFSALQAKQNRGPDRTWHVTCPVCGDGHGFVTKVYAEKKGEEEYWQYKEARRILIELGILKAPPKKTAKKLMAELGF